MEKKLQKEYSDYVIDKIFKKTFKFKNYHGQDCVIFPFISLSYRWENLHKISHAESGQKNSFFSSTFRTYVNRLYGVHIEDTLILCNLFITYFNENLSSIREKKKFVFTGFTE